MVRVNTRRLTENEFALATQKLPVTPKSKALAKKCMVDGEQIKHTAETAGVSRSNLNSVIKTIWEKHNEDNDTEK